MYAFPALSLIATHFLRNKSGALGLEMMNRPIYFLHRKRMMCEPLSKLHRSAFRKLHHGVYRCLCFNLSAVLDVIFKVLPQLTGAVHINESELVYKRSFIIYERLRGLVSSFHCTSHDSNTALHTRATPEITSQKLHTFFICLQHEPSVRKLVNDHLLSAKFTNLRHSFQNL